MNFLNISQWDELFKKTKHFMISENGKFSFYRVGEGKKKSILATALGVELMVLIAQNNEAMKEEVMPFLQKSVDTLIKNNAVLNDDMIVYLEKGI